ncbi:extracellular sulfatase Sulf-2-like [Actinia tenebrosa]|uniref:Extracellular sulfatase Sulf-2-like n=1 Tax=Actinia tenebrosa TaxID=6105 RepID=A0A6P8HV45_ACTTE|nr:extracellular sulfatase Sulf-2-like [Actinia tenebrosa]
MVYCCGIDMKLLYPLLFLLCFLCQTTQGRKRNKAQSKPNIIFILTDDQDSELGSMWVMNKTREIFSSGAAFVNAFVTSPICCPSRSSILTGMYAHNHNTLTNNINCSSPNWRAGPERKSYARYLSDAGYLTGHFGKYLNEYDGSYIPAGWHRWVGLVRNSRFYNYTLRHNTFFRRHSNVYKRDYFTDVITNHSLAFFRHAKARNPERPILMVISHSAPHGPEDGAPQYKDTFENITSPRLPNWNFISPDKHWIVRVTPEMTNQKIAFSDLLYRKRLQTLLSVDESIQRVYDMLKDTGNLDNTYIFFSSDHGYHLGQYGLVKGKSMPYETDIRIPLYARGPNIPTNIKMHQVVLNIDLAPTFLDIAGVKAPRSMDGVSIMKLFRRLKSQDDKPRVRRKSSHMWRDTFLVERGKPKRYAKSKVVKKLKKPTKATFLEQLCLKTKYRTPCALGQEWHCVRLNGQQRLRKCKKVSIGQQFVPSTSPPTLEVEMCTCYRPKLPWMAEKSSPNDEPHGDDWEAYLRKNEVELSKQLRRFRRSVQRTSLKEKQITRELSRAMKQQTRRNKAKMLEQESKRSQEEEESDNPDLDVDGKLQRLNARIAGIKNRLEMLRGRKKKLIRIKEEKETEKNFKEKYEEFPCACPVPSRSVFKKSRRPKRSRRSGRLFERLRSGMIDPEVYRRKMNKKMMKRSGLRSGMRKSLTVKRKKKTEKKKSSRRSKCSIPGLNCFYQTNDHWKSEPLWKGGEFCFCPSSSNNTFWCLRTINQHQNFLYCEFITQFLEYFDLNADPYQLYNIVDRISPSVLYDLHNQLEHMKGCKGAQSCTQYHGKPRPTTPSPLLNITEQPVLMSTPEPTQPTTVQKTTDRQEVITPTRNASSEVEESPSESSSEIEKGISENKNETRSGREEIEGKRREKEIRKKNGNKAESVVDKEKTEKKKRRKKKRNGKALKTGNKRNKNENENLPTELTPTTVAPTLMVEKERKKLRREKKIRPGLGTSKEQKQLKKREKIKSRHKNKGNTTNGRKGVGSNINRSYMSTVTPTTSQARDEDTQKDEQQAKRYEEEIPEQEDKPIEETANL